MVIYLSHTHGLIIIIIITARTEYSSTYIGKKYSLE